MRRLPVLLCAILCLPLLLCSCAQLTFQNTAELLRAPVMNPALSEVQSVLKEHVKGGGEPQLKFPKEGEWRSPMLLVDMDGDGSEEAVLFYSMSSGAPPGLEPSDNVYISVLRKEKGEWQVTDTQAGLSTDVASIEVANVFNDNSRQLIVGYTNSTVKVLVLYQYQGGVLASYTTGQQQYITYLLADFTGDGRQQIAYVSPVEQEGTGTSTAKLFILSGTEQGSFAQKEVSLYSNFTATSAFYLHPSKTAAGVPLLVVDGFATAGLLVSQVLTYSAEGDRFIYDEDAASIAEFALATSRRSPLLISRDIDGDGVVEIPQEATTDGGEELLIPIEGSEYRLKFVTWKDFTSGEQPTDKEFGILDDRRNLYIRLPDEWKDEIILRTGEEEDEWVICSARSEVVLLSLRALQPDEVYTEEMKRVPGDMGVYLIPGKYISEAQKDVIQGISLL